MERDIQNAIKQNTQETAKPSQYKNPKVTKIQQLFADWEDDGLRHQIGLGKSRRRRTEKLI
ncbi:hypothetical protein [Oribacterium asaccharolyticum]|uniref:hypothetical protein n=1 Tax=Oribacterium asaccharolyticum TaxID=1501332 RepID=UPI0028E97904|nr:hypothetical protein [Oribacterium asaccharolyticum]